MVFRDGKTPRKTIIRWLYPAELQGAKVFKSLQYNDFMYPVNRFLWFTMIYLAMIGAAKNNSSSMFLNQGSSTFYIQ